MLYGIKHNTLYFVRQSNAFIPASSTGTTVSSTFASPVLASSLLIATCTWGVGSGNATFSDSSNGAWPGTAVVGNDGVNGQSLATLFKAMSAAASTISITATFASADHRGIMIHEIGVIDYVTPLDSSRGETKASGTTQTSGTVTVSKLANFIYSAIIEDSAGTATITNPTLTTLIRPAIVNSVNISSAYKTGPNSGTTTATFIFSAAQTGIMNTESFRSGYTSNPYSNMVTMNRSTY